MTHAFVVPYDRGQTDVTGTLDHLLGQVREFQDIDYADTGRIKPRLSGGIVRCRWVKNSSGGALLPGEIVTYGATTFLTEVGAKAGADARGHGVVDEYLPAAGVADTGYFWIVTFGPCRVIQAGNDILAAGDEIVTGASGRVDQETAAPADTTATMVQKNANFGIALEAAAATAALKFRAFVNFEK